MPLYSYKCRKCDSVYKEVKPMADHKNGPFCCEEKTFQLLQPTMVNDNFLGSFKNEGYISPMSGRHISTKKARNDEMKGFNVVAKG